MPNPSLGLVMIVKDEALNLPRSLAPVAACFDEVVVVDTGSADDTAAMASAMGARVFQAPWRDDFAAARNVSLEAARSEWLLWLDADNAITPQGVALLRAAIPQEGPAILWAREQVVPSGEYLWQKRCFPRRGDVRFEGRVHEQLSHPPHWPGIMTPVVIQHWGYADQRRKQAKSRYYLSLLEHSLEECPTDFYSRWQAGRCLSDQRLFDKAASYFSLVAADDQARERNQAVWLDSWLGWARCLERLERRDEVLALLKQLLDIAPSSGPAHLARGRLAYQLGDWAGAETHLRQALTLGMGLPMLDLDPDKGMFQAAFYLARALQRLGRGSEALEALERAVAFAPDNAAARVELANLLWEQGQRLHARNELKRLLQSHPRNRQGLDLLSRWGEAA